MRASEMDDVIFAGTNNRPARNNAEVAISIDNAERTAPAAFNDDDTIDISRRIEREAGSTYRINGREVRARDVQMLFADASTGARSPALVHQGRIGEIIQAKPEQRRRVLEEAAGISGLHARRHEAELRLKAAETNLLRVEDVIGQLAAPDRRLKRQARQAIRYRNVSAQVRKSRRRSTICAGPPRPARSPKQSTPRTSACARSPTRVGAEAEAAKRQALAAAALPALREAEARAAAALHRLIVARHDSTPRSTAPRSASPSSIAAGAIRRRRRARAQACRRRRGRARAARRRGRRLAQEARRKRRAPQRRRCARGRRRRRRSAPPRRPSPN